MAVMSTAMVTSIWGRRNDCVRLDFFAFIERWSYHGGYEDRRDPCDWS